MKVKDFHVEQHKVMYENQYSGILGEPCEPIEMDPGECFWFIPVPGWLSGFSDPNPSEPLAVTPIMSLGIDSAVGPGACPAVRLGVTPTVRCVR